MVMQKQYSYKQYVFANYYVISYTHIVDESFVHTGKPWTHFQPHQLMSQNLKQLCKYWALDDQDRGQQIHHLRERWSCT